MEEEATKLIQSREDNYCRLTELIDVPELDVWRNEQLPAELVRRHGEKDVYLTRDELIKLMDWKLKKGKFRATLPKLIRQNESTFVMQCTRGAFSTMLKDLDKELTTEEYTAMIKSAMKGVCLLRGVGPATGSLILSSLSGITSRAPPFFSDEAGSYVLSKMGVFKGKLKYTMGEYLQYLSWFVDLDPHLEHNKTLLEQGAWCEWLSSH